MTYYPDHPKPSEAARRLNPDAFPPKTLENTPETGPEYATFTDNPLEDMEDRETHPPAPSIAPDLADRHGISLPPGTRLITDAD